MPAIAGGDNAASAPRSIRRDRLVGLWLLAVAAMVAIMILVGGATRLTDSGLSITEWKPISGALPPAGAEAWAAEFAKYRQTAEYRLQNHGMSLAQFQAIYWWEWGHRLLGRLIGVAFAVPFLIFLASGRLRGRALACTGLLALGAAQGAIGWWMVQSGLTDRLDVAPYRLAVHLGVAVLILGGALWLGLERFWTARGGGAA
ncbi:MAG: COX15/CtaA family protein, partial [Hyphomonadaceae bacterium]|nr:COX15/CtaA family protein [Hyphomonadaceae bacterium]